MAAATVGHHLQGAAKNSIQVVVNPATSLRIRRRFLPRKRVAAVVAMVVIARAATAFTFPVVANTRTATMFTFPVATVKTAAIVVVAVTTAGTRTGAG